MKFNKKTVSVLKRARKFGFRKAMRKGNLLNRRRAVGRKALVSAYK